MSDFNLTDVLIDLCAADGVSGTEENIAALCEQYLSRYGRAETDEFNNVICTVGEHDESKPTLLLDAHLDEIGMVVTYIDDSGFLKASGIGLDERVLSAAQVTILGRRRLYGIVTSVPPHLQTDKKNAVSIDELYIDTGLDAESVKEIVSLGDRVLIENRLEKMGELVTSKALDDRCCCAAVIYALELLKNRACAYNIKVLFSSKEETGSQGAKTAAFKINADLAVAVDVSFAKSHSENEDYCGEIGKGAMIGFSPVLSKRLSCALKQTAEQAGIDYQIEVMSGRTGTNADVIAVSACGVPTCTLSIPIRYMHTPVEMAAMSDVENTGELIVQFCERGLF
ncbi:MAG: M20/M25/M40 family metallo-hydrolase [Ruminococcus sp.]|nr:M20/M25/M40 family metallo-hydrolase [Ruminococcus sp.]